MIPKRQTTNSINNKNATEQDHSHQEQHHKTAPKLTLTSTPRSSSSNNINNDDVLYSYIIVSTPVSP